MLAVALAAGLARQLSSGTIYTRKLLRRGIDIELLAPGQEPSRQQRPSPFIPAASAAQAEDITAKKRSRR